MGTQSLKGLCVLRVTEAPITMEGESAQAVFLPEARDGLSPESLQSVKMAIDGFHSAPASLSSLKAA